MQLMPMEQYGSSSDDTMWTVVQHYETGAQEARNKYAKVLCVVDSPTSPPEGEVRDVYCSDIPGYYYT